MKKILLIILILQLLALSSALTIKNVNINPEEVAPGNSFKVEIEIYNNLDKDALNVEVSLNLENVPFAPKISSEKYKEKIKEDDEEIFNFELTAQGNAEAGAYKVPVKVKYETNEELKEKEFTISVVVNAKPDFILNSNNLLLKNQKNEIEIQVTNKGLAKAKFLEMEIIESNHNILSQNNIYIGDLDSDDFDSASFEIFTKESSSITIPINLKYRDVTNRIYTDLMFLQLKVYSKEEAVKIGLIKKDNTIIYLGVAAGLIIIWFIYRKIKKRRR